MSATRWNTDSYVRACQLIHSDFYDYSQAVYVSKSVKVTIICPKHGPWQCLPLFHLKGSGCLRCSREASRVGNSEFVRRAEAVHGAGRYKYDLVDYTSNRIPVRIVCSVPQHGEFSQTPSSHLKGSGCPNCAIDQIKSSQRAWPEDIFKKAVEVHRGKYDYSLSRYVNIDTPILIRCPLHGTFSQTPYHHIHRATGCPKCGVLRRATSKRYSAIEYKEEVDRTHGSRYSYPLLQFEIGNSSLNNSSVTVICPEHGVFVQRAASHLYGRGCPRCGLNRTRSARALTLPKLTMKLAEVHDSTYTYLNLDEYRDTSSRLKIKCPKPDHPIFEQTVREHLQGRGCARCGHIKQGALQKAKFVADFETRATSVHEEANFTYPDLITELAGSDSIITVRCPQHGPFKQTAKYHLSGRGCSLCGRKRAGKNSTVKLSEILRRAIGLHRDKEYEYPYIDEEYRNKNSVVTIRCPKHGLFRQKISVHLEHQCGCQRCGALRGIGDPEVPGILYLMRFFGTEDFLKVGHTKKTVELRWAGSGSGKTHGLVSEVLFELKGTLGQVCEYEGLVLSRFADHQLIPVRLSSGRTECFDVIARDAILKFLQELREREEK